MRAGGGVAELLRAPLLVSQNRGHGTHMHFRYLRTWHLSRSVRLGGRVLGYAEDRGTDLIIQSGPDAIQLLAYQAPVTRNRDNRVPGTNVRGMLQQQTMGFEGRAGRLVGLVAVAASTACLTVAHVANLDDASCRSTLTKAISTTLVGQGEPSEVADRLAGDALNAMVSGGWRSVPFSVSSPSGTDYIFVFQLKKEGCLLRLCGRRKGFWTYTNDLTYLATEPLPGCLCWSELGLVVRRGVSLHGGQSS